MQVILEGLITGNTLHVSIANFVTFVFQCVHQLENYLLCPLFASPAKPEPCALVFNAYTEKKKKKAAFQVCFLHKPHMNSTG